MRRSKGCCAVECPRFLVALDQVQDLVPAFSDHGPECNGDSAAPRYLNSPAQREYRIKHRAGVVGERPAAKNCRGLTRGSVARKKFPSVRFVLNVTDGLAVDDAEMCGKDWLIGGTAR